MALDLPQNPNAVVHFVFEEEVVDVEANRRETPNNHLVALSLFLAACISPWIIAI
jgi:hypothetical protein